MRFGVRGQRFGVRSFTPYLSPRTPHPAPRTSNLVPPQETPMALWKSFKAKLFLAFSGIAFLILFSTGFALYSFNQFGNVVDNTAEVTIPGMISAMRLSEQSTLLAAIAPVLAASEEAEELRSTGERIDRLIGHIREGVSLLSTQKGQADEEAIFRISMQSEELGEKLSALKDKSLRQLLLKNQLRSVLKEVQKAHNEFADTVSPVMYGTSSLTSLLGKRTGRQISSAIKDLSKAEKTDSAYDEAAKSAQKSISELTENAIREMGYALDIKSDGSLLFALLHAGAETDRTETLTDIRSRFKNAHSSFRQAAAIFKNSNLAQRNPILAENVYELDKRISDLGEGENSVFELRGLLISLREDIRQNLSESREFATRMTRQINNLVLGVQVDMTNLQKSTKESKHTGESVLLLICAGCLISSALIAWITIRVIGRHEHDLMNAKENAEIAQKTAEAVNKKIIDSIQYAKMIQTSLLPNPENIRTYLPDSFFIWMPRDIVGGDILFAESVDKGFILAVIDCTGHGVPGAFMTMIASSALRRIVKDECCYRPAEILKRLNIIVRTALQQDTAYATSDDGLDAAICFIEARRNNQETKSGFTCNPLLDARQIVFAGAMLSLYSVHQNEIRVIKGDRHNVGYKKSDPNFRFSEHTLPVEKGTAFYMATDGFYDELGIDNRRFGTVRFKEMLKEIAHLPFEKQREILLKAFEIHKGNKQRQDDVTVAGFGFK